LFDEVIFNNGKGPTGEEIVRYFEVAGLFCSFSESFGGEALGGDEGEGSAEDLVLEGCVGRGMRMIGRVVLPQIGRDGAT
jgi:hypothetical protein